MLAATRRSVVADMATGRRLKLGNLLNDISGGCNTYWLRRAADVVEVDNI